MRTDYILQRGAGVGIDLTVQRDLFKLRLGPFHKLTPQEINNWALDYHSWRSVSICFTKIDARATPLCKIFHTGQAGVEMRQVEALALKDGLGGEAMPQ